MAYFLDPSPRPSMEQQRAADAFKSMTPPYSRSSSISSIASQRSEPGWMAALNGVDRGRNASVASGTSAQTAPGPGSKPSGLKKLFGGGRSKEEKERRKKETSQLVLTSRHAAAVKTKLALDPKFKQAMHKDRPPVTGTLNSAHLTAHEQELRHPHSGPPGVRSPPDKADMPLLTRIVSGDEPDEPDAYERARDEWRQRKLPDVNVVVEAESADSPPQSPGPVDLPGSQVVEHQGVRSIGVSIVDGDADKDGARPPRRHASIAGRYTRDDKGIWHK